MQEQLHTLSDMFPAANLGRIEEVITMYGVEDGVGILLEEAAADESHSTLRLPKQSSLQAILFDHAHQIMDHSREISLKVAKNTIWQQSLTFYKELKATEERQHRDITVEFDGEEGADAGALKMTFFDNYGATTHQ